MERVPVKKSHKRSVSSRSGVTQDRVCFRMGWPSSLDQGFGMGCECYRAGREVCDAYSDSGGYIMKQPHAEH